MIVSRKLLLTLLSAGILLLVPLIAMRFTDEVQWTLGDFLVAAILLVGTILIGWGMRRWLPDPKTRRIALACLLLLLALVWMELAVGLFGTPLAGS